MKRSVVRIYEKDFDLIDEFLIKNFSSPTHWKEWNLIAGKYFNTEFFYFACFEDDSLIGICPVHKKKRKYNFRLISGPKEFLIPFGGWIFSKPVEVKRKFVELKKNESLEIFSLPLSKEFNAVYSNVKILRNYETRIIDLTKSLDDLWKDLNQKRRNMIRKASKNNVSVRLLPAGNLEMFYDFYVSANKEYELESLPVDYFADLSNVPGNIKTDFLVAEMNNKPLGYNVIVSDKNYSVYWLGLRMKNFPNNGFFDLLQWESIKKAKENNCKYYDLCYVEKQRLPNIYKFKTDYSQTKLDVLNILEKSLLYSIINKIQKIML